LVDWLRKRDKKETSSCDTCGAYKLRAYFYDRYVRPEVAHLFRKEERYVGKICIQCAYRELGTKHKKKI